MPEEEKMEMSNMDMTDTPEPDVIKQDMSLAGRLRLIRGGIPQMEIAHRLGIHKSSWGRFERGDSEPSGSDLGKVCTTFGINPEWLLLGTGDMGRDVSSIPDQPHIPAEERIRMLEEQLDVTRAALSATENALKATHESLVAYKSIFEKEKR